MGARSSIRRLASLRHRLSPPLLLILVLPVVVLGGLAVGPAHATKGVTDWLNVADYGNNIQSAINAAPAGATVYLPDTTYAVSGQIKFPTNRPIRLLGSSIGGTTLNWSSAPGGNYVTMYNSGQIMEFITVHGTGSSTNAGAGLYFDPTQMSGTLHVMANCHVRDCSFENIAGWGVESPGDANNITNACTLENCGFNTVGGGVRLGTGCTFWTLSEINICTVSDPMLQLDSSSVVMVDRGGFGPTSTNANSFIKLNRAAVVTFLNCDIEGDNTDKFFVDMVGGFNYNISFIGCTFRRSEVYARLIRCVSPSLVYNLNVLNVSTYLNGASNANLLRTDDIVLDSPSSANIIGGTLGDNSAFRRMKIGGTATSVFSTNFNGGRVRMPKLTSAERDSLSGDAVAGDVAFTVDRLNHWDGSRWREDVEYFPSTTATNAAPGGINFPGLTTTQRNNIPTAFKVAGTVIYNTTTNQFNYWDGSVWKTY